MISGKTEVVDMKRVDINLKDTFKCTVNDLFQCFVNPGSTEIPYLLTWCWNLM